MIDWDVCNGALQIYKDRIIALQAYWVPKLYDFALPAYTWYTMVGS